MPVPIDKSVVPDFRGVQSFNEIHERFVESARAIMCSHQLVCGENRWQITALELYLFTESKIWRDIYTHNEDEQLNSGTWYVHHNGTPSPTYSGIDITCGSRKSGIYGGLLIRELNREQRWVFQRIVRGNRPSYPRKGNTWSLEEKSIIQETIHGSNIDSLLGPLRLVGTKDLNESLWAGPRIGLSKNRDDKNPEGKSFRSAPLRIATWAAARTASAN